MYNKQIYFKINWHKKIKQKSTTKLYRLIMEICYKGSCKIQFEFLLLAIGLTELKYLFTLLLINQTIFKKLVLPLFTLSAANAFSLAHSLWEFIRYSTCVIKVVIVESIAWMLSGSNSCWILFNDCCDCLKCSNTILP